MLKSGNFYKLGEGPINYSWNLRFFVLDETNQDLTYYQSEEEVKANGSLSLVDALISNITLIKERENSFSIQTAPPNGKTYFLSFNSLEEAMEWREAVIQASHKVKLPLTKLPPGNTAIGGQNSTTGGVNAGGNVLSGGSVIGSSGINMNLGSSFGKNVGVDRVSLLADRKAYHAPTHPQAWQKVEEEQFNEEDIFQDDRNFVEIEEFKRQTMGGGVPQLGSSAGPGQMKFVRGMSDNAVGNFGGSAIYAQSGSPDSIPLRLGRNHLSPNKFTPGSEEGQSRGNRGSGTLNQDYIDERAQSGAKVRNPIRRRIIQRSKKDYKIDMGQMTQEQAEFLTQIQKLVQEDQNDGKIPSNNWEVATVQNGLTIQALNPKSHSVTINKKILKKQLIQLVILFGVLYIIRNFLGFHIDYFYLGLILQLINLKSKEQFISLQPKYTMLRSKTIVSGDSLAVGEGILKCYKDSHYDSFDFMTVNVREINRDEQKHILTTEETLDLPTDYISRQFIERRQVKLVTYWCQDQNGYFYVLRKSLPTSGGDYTSGKYLHNIKEAFVCVPIENSGAGGSGDIDGGDNNNRDSEKCLVYFFSEFNYGYQGPSVIVNSVFQDSVKLMRMDILASMNQYQKYLAEKIMIHAFKQQQQHQKQNTNTNNENKQQQQRDQKMNMSELEQNNNNSGSQKKQQNGQFSQTVDQTGSQAYYQSK